MGIKDWFDANLDIKGFPSIREEIGIIADKLGDILAINGGDLLDVAVIRDNLKPRHF